MTFELTWSLKVIVHNSGERKRGYYFPAGCRAYACQCSWRSVVSIEELGGRGEREVHTERDVSTSDISVTVPQLSKLKWVCGRH